MVKPLNGARRSGSAAVNFLIGTAILLLGLLILGGLFFIFFGVRSTTTYTYPVAPAVAAPLPSPPPVVLPHVEAETADVEAPRSGEPTAP